MSAPLRHRFEPAGLVLGLPLIFVGVGCVLEALGDWQVPVRLLLLVVPVALVLAALTSLMTFLVRRGARERGAGSAAGPSGDSAGEPAADSTGEHDT